MKNKKFKNEVMSKDQYKALKGKFNSKKQKKGGKK